MTCKQLSRLLSAAILVCLLGTQVYAASPGFGSPQPLIQNESESGIRNAEYTFTAFSKKWLQTQATHVLASPDSPEIIQTRSDFTARVVHIDTAHATLAVEPTETPQAPYIGTLTYMLRVSTSKGDSLKAALAGPFIPSELLRITEIFLYRDGRWGAQ